MFGEGIAVSLNFFVGGLHIGRFERRLADDQGVTLSKK